MRTSRKQKQTLLTKRWKVLRRRHKKGGDPDSDNYLDQFLHEIQPFHEIALQLQELRKLDEAMFARQYYYQSEFDEDKMKEWLIIYQKIFPYIADKCYDEKCGEDSLGRFSYTDKLIEMFNNYIAIAPQYTARKEINEDYAFRSHMKRVLLLHHMVNQLLSNIELKLLKTGYQLIRSNMLTAFALQWIWNHVIKKMISTHYFFSNGVDRVYIEEFCIGAFKTCVQQTNKTSLSEYITNLLHNYKSNQIRIPSDTLYIIFQTLCNPFLEKKEYEQMAKRMEIAVVKLLQTKRMDALHGFLMLCMSWYFNFMRTIMRTSPDGNEQLATIYFAILYNLDETLGEGKQIQCPEPIVQQILSLMKS